SPAPAIPEKVPFAKPRQLGGKAQARRWTQPRRPSRPGSRPRASCISCSRLRSAPSWRESPHRLPTSRREGCGGSNNTLVLRDSQAEGLSGQLDGGGAAEGGDWLDYSGRNAVVAVNLTSGSATDVNTPRRRPTARGLPGAVTGRACQS